MKIATWNCNGALRKKLEEADSLNADVLVVQECEDPARSTSVYRKWAESYLWLGADKNKGVGVFPRKGNRVEALNWNGSFQLNGLQTTSPMAAWSTKELKLFLPFGLNDQYSTGVLDKR